ncbi:MAG TPA: PDZ domain-containing protein [Chthoniobacterales bacterium]|jgi:membrane-associated protease RseP (regulator of RpoE activity)
MTFSLLSFRNLVAAVLLVFPSVLVAEETPVSVGKPLSVVRVNGTTQAYDLLRPWGKKAAASRRALGAVLPGNKVLVTAEMVANQSYIELEKAGSGEKIAAKLLAVDYEANLALLAPEDPQFLEALDSLAIAPQVKTGDRLDVWQLENSGTLVATSGLVTSCEVGRYALEDYGYLLFKITAALQYRENSYTVPIVQEGKLAGLLLRFDPRSQTVESISLPVIQHFLKAAEVTPYRGFPRAGIQFEPTRDPQLRRYLKLPSENIGIYLSQVDPNTAASQAGLQKGDVILSVDDQTVDPDGNYSHPVFGKISINHLISTEHYVGDSIKITYSRGGEIKETTAIAADRPPQSYVIEPYVFDRAPNFLLFGGCLFQELSRQYLREWGNTWQKDAPIKFVYFDRYQSELFPPDRGRIVFISHILSAPSTVGYDQLSYLVVEKINNEVIKSIADVAKAIKTPLDGFHKIEVRDDPEVLYIDAHTVEADTAALAKQYGIPLTSRVQE